MALEETVVNKIIKISVFILLILQWGKNNYRQW